MNRIVNFFKIYEHNSTIKTEIIAGITTFMAMSYILIVNSQMFAQLGTVSYDAIYVATALSAVFGTLAIGIMANLPLAQASGMGLNAFFVYSVCFGLGFSYANALLVIFINGIIFIIITATGIREKIFEAIPHAVRISMPAGIGLFIAFLGFQDSGLIVMNESTFVSMASFDILNGKATWAEVMPRLVSLISLVIISVLAIRKVKGTVLWGIVGGTLVYYLLGFTIPGFYDNYFADLQLNPFKSFEAFGNEALGKVFTEGFDFSAYLSQNSMFTLIAVFITSELAFCMVDLFDTMGTLYGACARGNLLTKDGHVPNFRKALMSDALATTVGAGLGTSTITTFVEASTGVAEGGKTGFTSVVTAGLFFIALFFSPLSKLIPSCAMASSLIYVGILMMSCVKSIDWENPEESLPAFLTIVMMPFTCNISYGVAFGFFSSVLIRVFTGKMREIKAVTWIVTALFIIMFFVSN
ncbi:MAG: NCS2 family permease [Eubacterium sp.]|nr:NCS2 family permease [Eubacterium sp.]